VPVFKHRQSIRLAGFDYSRAGAYFVTLCSWQRESLFGSVVSDDVELNAAGRIVREEWLASFDIRQELRPDTFIVMPNHFHAIVWLRNGRHPTLVHLIAGFKASSTGRVNAVNGTPGLPVWQRTYYDRIVRHDLELNRIRQYILNNPLKWPDDPNHPERAPTQAVGATGGRPNAACHTAFVRTDSR